ncbi:MAG: hypothetical protein AAGF95_26410 [Chloroflexota bacterium]
MEIERIRDIITQIDQQILDISQNNDQYVDDYNYTTRIPYQPSTSSVESNWVSGGIVFVVMMIVVCGIGCCISEEVSKLRLSDTFPVGQGLGSWRTYGSVTLVEDGRGQFETSSKHGVQVEGPNSYIYQIAEDQPRENETYTATTWCKAPIGAKCRLFLGSVQEGTEFPIQESNKTITRDGTGNWESMTVTISAEPDQPLAVFLYSETDANPIIYDDLEVRRQ